jgi:hypothetical protein
MNLAKSGIPNFGRRFVFNAHRFEFELTFPDPMREFDAGDGDRGAPKALQSKHWTQTKFDRSMVAFARAFRDVLRFRKHPYDTAYNSRLA